MKENYCHLVNVTNTLISYTTVGSLIRINCNESKRLDLCKEYNTTFSTIEVIPIYKKIVELLKISIDLTLDCKNPIEIDYPISNSSVNCISKVSNVSRIKNRRLNYNELIFIVLFILILNYSIRLYRIKINKLK
jgi:hypothetical protein